MIETVREMGEGGGDGWSEKLGLLALPEECIETILSLASPKDACRLSLLCSTFASAAKSDAVWKKFLPQDYAAIVSESPSASSYSLPAVSSMRELYFRLCDFPILVDSGAKSFSLERQSGKVCYMLSARDLCIEGAGIPDYWKWSAIPSRFAEAAVLLKIWRFEIQGVIRTCVLSQNTNYAAYFVFKWTEGSCGFSHHPLELYVELFGGEKKARTIQFEPLLSTPSWNYDRNWRPFLLNPVVGLRTNESWKWRTDGWCEIEIGEFFINMGDENEVLKIGLAEVKSGDLKSGLIVCGIDIRPKEG